VEKGMHHVCKKQHRRWVLSASAHHSLPPGRGD
jgi:hypothetical protein